ncbi:hypothetical protein PP707_04535 [Acetobacter pasteurianus]|nr:hypothetical protein [Acetobacter pasteurianus]
MVNVNYMHNIQDIQFKKIGGEGERQLLLSILKAFTYVHLLLFSLFFQSQRCQSPFMELVHQEVSLFKFFFCLFLNFAINSLEKIKKKRKGKGENNQKDRTNKVNVFIVTMNQFNSGFIALPNLLLASSVLFNFFFFSSEGSGGRKKEWWKEERKK